MQQIAEWVAASGLTRSQVAERAGLARSTVLRIEAGETAPSLRTLRELAIACGLDIDLHTRPVSDPAAAEAARFMLEAGYGPHDQAGADSWVDRLTRQAGQDPVEVTRAAGQAASLTHRPGAFHLTGPVPLLRVASAGEGAGGAWAISGAPPLGVEGTIVLWSERPDVAARLLGEALRKATSPTVATVIVAGAHPAVFQDSWRDGPLRYVAPIQMLLDAFGLEPALQSAAFDEARRW
ncbi:helix-turn-helix transcriptional regulator [Cellulomonas fimi]|uniref:Helix-turn-helix transcriptional regulator n=1 Tax=Cellulomonas fimi TaxID=1708 RepID=A0A7Y0LXJ1_CELFI|nr:helix-turn-helix transcriptional regulator [Cellulomonas fimi]NMR19805.1 helix-turn-helix transcriptional regulator [Cellulomonas fimi]